MVIAQKITDSATNISDEDIRPGSATCPTCKSDRWNSAITVVIEGTTNAKSTFTETFGAAAKQAGHLDESLLSDKWFSWDYPIDADLGLNARSGLVQEVKRFMVEFGSVMQMPSPPRKPNQPAFIRNSPKETGDSPSVAQAPTPCGTADDPVTWKKSRQSTAIYRLAQSSIVIVLLMIGLTGAYVLFGHDVISAPSLLIIFASIMIVTALKAKWIPRVNIVKDDTGQKETETLPETLKDYAKDRENFREEAERFRSRCEEFQRRLSEYKILAEETVLYEQQSADYRIRRRAVLKARERLWARTRLCIRCGTAYLGPS